MIVKSNIIMQYSRFDSLYILRSELLQIANELIEMAKAMLSTMEIVEPLPQSPESRYSLTRNVNIKSINDFPDEILLKILSHFGPEELCINIANVCERWSALSKDITLWKKLGYKCDDLSTFTSVVEVLTEAPTLKCFEILKRNDAAQLLGLLFDSCDGIKKLVLKFCKLGEDSTGLLANIVTFYPDLEELVLEGCYPLNYTGYSLIPRLEKLCSLNLSHCKGLTGPGIRGIVEKCCQLKELSLDDITEIFDDDVMHVIQKVGAQLTTLILDGEDLTDASFCCLHHCSRLQVLEISFCDQMTDKGLLEGVGALQELRSLRLKRGHNLTAPALSTFLHRPAMACIVCLNLSECSSLDDHGLEGIANRCQHLTTLSLCWCWEITDAGILQLISHCSKLQNLDMLGVVRLTGSGYFALVPTHLPVLKRLNLEQCNNICDESLAELVAAMPQLEVIDYYGERVDITKENNIVTVIQEDDTDWILCDN